MSEVARRLTISTPDAAHAELLADELSAFSAETSNKGDWWCVTMAVDEADERFVPNVLAALRAWLSSQQIASTSVYYDGHTHVIHAAQPADAARWPSE